MSDQPLSSSMSLDTTDFKTGISQANRELRVLESGFRASVATMGDWNKSSEGLGNRLSTLTQKIDVQKQKVSMIEAEYKRLAAEKGENSRAAQEMQIRLNRETESLGKMEAELDKTADAMGDMAKESVKTSKETEKVGKESKKAEKDVKSFGDKLKDLGKGVAGVLKGVGSAIGNVAKTAAKGVGLMLAGAAGGAVALGRAVIDSFGEQEQNLDGAVAVFGDYADHIQKVGEEAYRTMGATQSQYLASANIMGALFQGSGLDVQRSAELTEQALQRAADMASVMGIDVQMALDSVAGAAKGNFTMMDNLGVAMNATTIEAYAAGKGLNFVWAQATQAEKAEMAMEMFFERTSQYAGNFEREATTTVTGSLGLLKASTASWIAGLGNANADMVNLTQNVVQAFGAVKDNVVPVLKNVVSALPEATGALIEGAKEILPELLPVIITILMQIFEMITGLMPELIPAGVEMVTMLVEGVVQALPQLLAAGVLILEGLVGAILEMAPTLMKAAPELISQFVNSFLQLLPMLLTVGVMILTALAQGIIQMMPELVPVAVDLIMSLVEGLMNALPDIITAGIAILMGLVSGLRKMLPQLIPVAVQMIVMLIQGISETLPELMVMIAELIPEIVIVLIENLPLLIEAAIQLIMALVDGLIAALPILIGYAPEIIIAIFDALIEALPMILDAGVELIGKLIEGLMSVISTVVEKGPEIVGNLIEGIKEALPKLVEGGKELLEKIGEGIKTGLGNVKEWGKEVLNQLWEGIKSNWNSFIELIKGAFGDFFGSIFGRKSGSTGYPGVSGPQSVEPGPVVEGEPATASPSTKGGLFAPLATSMTDMAIEAAQVEQDVRASVSALLRPNQLFGSLNFGGLQPAGVSVAPGYGQAAQPVTIVINSTAPVDLEMLANKVARKLGRR